MICAWKYCNNEFQPKTHREKYCCKNCAKAAHSYRVNEREKKDRKAAKVQRKCAVCPNMFYPTSGGTKTCSKECREIYYRDYHSKYYQNVYKKVRQGAKQEEEIEYDLPKVERKPLDGKVLHKAEMTVDEYNRTHGTNYSYGQYVHYVERNLL